MPGFASLARAPDESTVFVPLLGFEGARFAHVLEAVQPDRPDIYPIVGVPGFRPEYPFHTYLGNRSVLSETRSWHNVRYVPANCAFSVYQTLEEIARRNPGRTIQVAPIGTKPHALGSVLFTLDHPDRMEIVYDHPVRKEMRTSGFSRVCLYDLSLLPTLRVDRRAEDRELPSARRRER